MVDISPSEHRVWTYLLQNPLARAEDICVRCVVPLELAQSCIDRIGTPREVFEQEAKQREVKPTRVQTLETAIHLTGGDRNKSYGPPYDNLSDCADLWNAYINTKVGCLTVQLDAEDVAWMMTLVKMTRSFQPGYHPDNYTDAAAYSAIAGECREIQIEAAKKSEK
jgi:hypothetical protein